MIELLSCPLCGCTAVNIELTQWCHQIWCDECELTLEGECTLNDSPEIEQQKKDAVIVRWNTRQPALSSEANAVMDVVRLLTDFTETNSAMADHIELVRLLSMLEATFDTYLASLGKGEQKP